MNLKLRKYLPYFFMMPAFVLIFSLLIYVLIYNLYNTFMSEASFGEPPHFVGWSNYLYVFSNQAFLQAIKNTFVWTFGVSFLQFFLGMGTALFLNKKLSINKILRPFFVLPWVMPGVVAALAWRWMYDADYGIINSFLLRMRLINNYIGWLSDPSIVMLSVIIVGVWKGFPFYTVMLFGGLQGIPSEIYEASKIDGANSWQTFIFITFPSLRIIIIMSLTLGIIWTSNYFEAIYVLTGGGPARMTETLPVFIYNTAFSYFRLHDAAVPSIVLLFLVMIFVGIYYVFLKKQR